MHRTATHTILLIEADTSLRRMIALGLQYRGLRVIAASSTSHLPIDADQPVDLLVLDLDGEAGTNHELLGEAQSHPRLSSVPIVALAWEPPTLAHMSSEGQPHHPDDQGLTYIAKPFDARTLHATIEQLLLTARQAPSTLKQTPSLVSSTSTSAPSICPLITAIGLLLAFTGLLLQIIVAAVGLFIVVVALLWWTLGTKPANKPLAIETS